MPTITLTRSDTSKPVCFSEMVANPNNWSVDDVKLAGRDLPNDAFNAQYVSDLGTALQGRLSFAGNAEIASVWPTTGNGTVTVNVSINCNGHSNPVTVKLHA